MAICVSKRVDFNLTDRQMRIIADKYIQLLCEGASKSGEIQYLEVEYGLQPGSAREICKRMMGDKLVRTEQWLKTFSGSLY